MSGAAMLMPSWWVWESGLASVTRHPASVRTGWRNGRGAVDGGSSGRHTYLATSRPPTRSSTASGAWAASVGPAVPGTFMPPPIAYASSCARAAATRASVAGRSRSPSATTVMIRRRGPAPGAAMSGADQASEAPTPR